MNAQELFTSEAKATGVFFCSKCRVVFRDKAEAEKCCRPYTCETCGCETLKYYSKCASCRARESEEMAQAILAEAQEVEGWCELFLGDKFFSDDEELVLYLSDVDEIEDIDNFPDFAHTATATGMPELTAQDLVFDAIENDIHEDFDVEDLDGLDELQRALDVFRNKNADVVLCYKMDTSKKVNLDRYKAEAKKLFMEWKETDK